MSPLDYNINLSHYYAGISKHYLSLHLDHHSLSTIPKYPKCPHVLQSAKALFIPYLRLSPLTHTSHILTSLITASPPRFQPQLVTTGLPLQTRHFPPPNSGPALGMLPGETPAGTRPVLRSRGGGEEEEMKTLTSITVSQAVEATGNIPPPEKTDNLCFHISICSLTEKEKEGNENWPFESGSALSL